MSASATESHDNDEGTPDLSVSVVTPEILRDVTDDPTNGGPNIAPCECDLDPLHLDSSGRIIKANPEEDVDCHDLMIVEDLPVVFESDLNATLPRFEDEKKQTPPVPFNSPDECSTEALEEVLKNEAKKQEMELKQRLADRALLADLFRTPEGRPHLGKPRKRILIESTKREDNDEENVTFLDEVELMTREARISPCNPAESLNEREVARRERIQSSLDLLRKLVPGVRDDSDKVEVYEKTSKYVLFLKSKVGAQFDVDFLHEFLPY